MWWRILVTCAEFYTCTFRGATDTSVFFQSQGGSLACFLAYVILRFTSCATPADYIQVSMTVESFRLTYLQTPTHDSTHVRWRILVTVQSLIHVYPFSPALHASDVCGIPNRLVHVYPFFPASVVCGIPDRLVHVYPFFPASVVCRIPDRNNTLDEMVV